MFDMDIMNDAENMCVLGYSFDSVSSFLFREGYELMYDIDEVADRCIEGEETFELSNGWVVCELR